MKKGLITILLSMAHYWSHAQVANYNFQEVVESFRPLSDYSNATIVSHQVDDYMVIPERVDIPFLFKFANASLDSLNVHANGFIWFGNVKHQQISSINPLSHSPHPLSKGYISAIGADLHPQAHTDYTTEVNTGFIGNPPNRIFIIEWLNTSRFSSVWDYEQDDTLNFQIRLHEGTDIVDVCFGHWGINATNRTYAEVGLKSSAFDLISRKAYNVPWTQTQPGTAPADHLILKGNYKPSSGQVFRWIPPYSITALKKEVGGNSLKIFPSFVEDRIYIREESENNNWNSYMIFDLTGRIMQHGFLNENEIPVTLQAGTYILELSNSLTQSRKKFVKL